jgi:NitT/TauT family transport system permease protein
MQPKLLALGLVILLAVAGVWELAVRLLHISPFLLPPPSAIAEELIVRTPIYLQQGWVTLGTSVLGFLVASIAGAILGSLIVYSWVMRGIFYPLILVLQVVPKVALAPLLVVWTGYGLQSRMLVVALIAFFPVVISTVTGLSSVERDLLDLVRMLGGNRLQEFIKIAFPHAMPFIFSGLKVAVTLAVIGEIVAEFVSGNTGLGYLILVANSDLNVAMSFAAIVLLSVMGFALFAAVELLEKIVIPWNAGQEEPGISRF